MDGGAKPPVFHERRMYMMKKIAACCALVFLALTVLSANAETWEAACEAYEPVLAQYAAGLSGDEDAWTARDSIWDAYRCASFGEDDPLTRTGYTLMDLNGDGSPELVTGEIPEEGQGDGLIFEILTVRDGSAATVIRGWERYRVSLTFDPQAETYGYYAEGSSSAFQSVYECGKVAGDMAAWENAHTLEAITDENTDVTRWTLDGAEIDEAAALELIAAWQENTYAPALRSFAALLDARNVGFVDEKTPRQEGAWCRSFRIESGDVFDVTVADTGRRNAPEARWENVLSVTVASRDGRLNQQFEYDSAETPLTEIEIGMAWLEDMNFDGCPDLVLCTAMGAYNEFAVFCLWNPETGGFDPVTACRAFDMETRKLADEDTPLELVNYILDGAHKQLISYGKNGYAAHIDEFFAWDDAGKALRLLAVYDVYDADGGKMGERFYDFSAQGELLWDALYPVDWYYGDTEPFADHAEGAAAWIDGQRVTKRVADTDWVNLRERDSKESASLARLNAGTEVQVLKENCADGWTLVLWDAGEAQESKYRIGYIWHEYLK